LGDLDDVECIVVDDGSTDDTAAKVASLQDKRIRLVRQEHAGVAAAANRATREARHPLIARMDADDFSHPNRLADQRQMLLEARLDVAGGAVRIVDEEGVSAQRMARYERWLNSLTTHEAMFANRFVESPVVNPTALARREVFELGYREGPFPEDYDLWLRAFQTGCQFGKLDTPVLDWTDGSSRLTRTSDRYTFEAFDRSRREHLLAGPLQGQPKVNLWGAGQTGKPWLRWLLTTTHAVDFVIDVAPGKIGKKIQDTAVISPDELPPSNGVPLLIAVGAEGARELIEPVLLERGYRIGGDAWFVA
tara:strand:+ start:16116 stop:17033 length:918 start_codon:yes stop_codon:yes gene_type:complete